ncbi:hypothetical protein OAC41_00305 [Acidimicrobiales bacterium]|jgi:hypothetical protein|nr:hypothetical protein [bacterium]MDB2392896.1 hypothetical protein [Acidimicrobiaceae bacterium]MDB9845194.1 hypothetical protein [Acidimicrobiales bacterium]
MAERDENVVPVYDVPGREQSVLVDHIVEQADGLVGARMVTFESTGVSRDEAIEREEHKPSTPALTTESDDGGLLIGVPGL